MGVCLTLVTAVSGLSIVAHAMSQLRWAHLYRQRSREGLGFVGVGAELVAGGLLAVAAAVGLYLFGRSLPTSARFTSVVASAAVVLMLVVCALMAMWVQAQVNQCIGSCG